MASGQCYSCGTGFSLFKKEHGCKQCGFAFCAKCLTKSAEIPKLNNSKHKVCNKCYNILTGKQGASSDVAKYSPPEAYKKRIAALADRGSESSHHGSHGSGGSGHHKGRSKPRKPEDEIAQRLQKLREKPTDTPPVRDEDLHKRLANLKGIPAPSEQKANQPYYQPPKRLTQQEEVDQLLNEIADEVEIDAHLPPPAAEVESRLAKLKGQAAGVTTGPSNTGGNDLNKLSPENQNVFNKNIESKGATSKSGFARDDDEVSVEEMSRLMQEAARDLELDAQRALQGLQQDQAIMARLNELKKRKNTRESAGAENPDKTSNLVPTDAEGDSDDENEDVAAQKIIMQFLEEAKLEEHEPGEAEGSDSKGKKTKDSKEPKKRNTDRKDSCKKSDDDNNLDDDDDELPYCCMCTEDATIRCHGCDLDLYCTRCFRESHKQCGMTDHETSKYTVPKSWKGP